MLVIEIIITILLSLLSIILSLNIDVNINNDGSFIINTNGNNMFESGEVFIITNKKYSTIDSTLLLKSIDKVNGNDILGYYQSTDISYIIQENDNVIMINKIKVYDNFIIFEQFFPNDVTINMIDINGKLNADDIITSFPSFNIRDDDTMKRGYAHYVSWFYQDMHDSSRRKTLVAPGFQSPTFGIFDSSISLTGGIGGSGVTVVFNEDISVTAILSPFENMMSMNHVSTQPGSLNYGIMGNVKQIPQNFNIKTILYFSENGINYGMREWGTIMRMYYGKPSTEVARQKDITLQYLGYTTDNGMYYYYNTGDYSNYEDVLIAVKKYADEEQIPYKYVLLDSWWYYKGDNGGVTDWSPRSDIFPNGLDSLYKQTGLLVQAHNRYWSNQTLYAKQNGGSYNFLFDSGNMGGAVPIDQAFWDDLFGNKASWGLRVYEQDWLFNEFYIYVEQMLESVSLSKTWLHQMGTAAAKNGLTIQYCMPYIRHLLTSLEIPAVTQGRASDDYVLYPHEGPANWKIGGQSLLIDSLGLAPSKDGFYSTSFQRDNPYGKNRFEPNPSLQALVTTLSTGPVAIGDGINYSNAKLIMRSCRKDGLLLNPSYAATKIDKAMLQNAFGGNAGPEGEVWSAASMIHYRRYGYLFAADVTKSSTIVPLDLDRKLDNDQYWAVLNNNDNNEKIAIKFSNDSPLTLITTKVSEEFNFYVILPIEDNGWSLYGELNKWVSVSSRRVTNINTFSTGGMSATVKGVTGEEIEMAFICPEGKFHYTKCTFDSTQVLTIYSNGQCQ